MTKLIVSLPTFLTYSLGCRVNQAEISVISEQLTVNSLEIFNEKIHSFPDIVLVNTCAVTSKAERESRKAIHHFKRLFPKAKIICLGCSANFVKDADLVIENQNKANFLKIILQKFPTLNFKTPRMVTKQRLRLLRGEKSQDNLFSKSGRALVKIQEGCDQFCSYCIVPYLRGKLKSNLPRQIICQINHLVQSGIKEIILCGINLSLYGRDSSAPPQNDNRSLCHPEPFDLTQGKLSEGSPFNLTGLLKRILEETKAERISLSSIEPEYIYQNKEFVNLFVDEPRLSKYFHLALQSGSPDTLKAMGRKTDLEKLMKTLRFIKEKYPEFTFRADIIVGFPTETENNFQETLEFIKQAPITFVHVFPCSIRPGTLTEKKIRDKRWQDISSTIKKDRAKKVMELTKKIQKEGGKKLIGKTLPCLIIRKVSGGYEAMAGNSWNVKLHGTKHIAQNLQCKILSVRIINLSGKFLRGEVIY